MKYFKGFVGKIEEKIKIYLSHRPRLYALIVGIGIVLFWRGVWHSTDLIHTYFNIFQNNLSIDASASPWWDGPLSFVVGIVVLHFTGAFTSSFIGNELILSGLRGEKRLTEKTESEVKDEEQFISDIKEELSTMTEKIDQLEKEVHKKRHLG
jgi:type I restriction-modification system DNA methylase subunit